MKSNLRINLAAAALALAFCVLGLLAAPIPTFNDGDTFGDVRTLSLNPAITRLNAISNTDGTLDDVAMLDLDQSAVTISTGSASVTGLTLVQIQSEGGVGTADTLTNLTGGVAGQILVLLPRATDEITVQDSATGAGEIDTQGMDDALLDSGGMILVREATDKWRVLTVSPDNLTVAIPTTMAFALSDETSAVTASDTVPKLTYYAPYAMTATGVGGMATTAPVGATMILDVHLNGTSIMTTDKIDILTTTNTDDGTATLTTTAIAAGDKLEFFIDQIGSGTAGAGVKLWIDGTRD